MTEQESTGPKSARGMALLEIFLTHHVANNSLRHQAQLNARTKQEFGVDVPVLPLGNVFNVKQTAAGTLGKLASLVVGAALGAGGMLLTQSPPAMPEQVEDAYTYVVDLEWMEESEHTEETIDAEDADDQGSAGGGN